MLEAFLSEVQYMEWSTMTWNGVLPLFYGKVTALELVLSGQPVLSGYPPFPRGVSLIQARLYSSLQRQDSLLKLTSFLKKVMLLVVHP